MTDLPTSDGAGQDPFARTIGYDVEETSFGWVRLRLRDLTPADVRRWHAGLGTATPTARSHAYGLLRSILATAVTDDLIPANPCHIRGAATVDRVRKIEPASLADLEVLVAAMPEQYRVLTLLAAWCGLRFGELGDAGRSHRDSGRWTPPRPRAPRDRGGGSCGRRVRDSHRRRRVRRGIRAGCRLLPRGRLARLAHDR